MTRTFGLSQDLPPWAVALAALLSLLGLALLLVELRRSAAEGKVAIALTGVLASVLALGAVLRPVSILARGTRIGARVLVLVDRSRSMLLPGTDGTRDEAARRAVDVLQREAKDARLTVLGFGERVEPWRTDDAGKPAALRSDLLGALRKVMSQAEELPQALVVVSDGRLELPEGPGVAGALRGVFPGKPAPIHTISVADRSPRDASVRSVKTAGAAVAHQPVSVSVEVGCSGGLPCDALPVAVRELLDGAPPALLASGIARMVDGKATLDLQVTLDRAGPRLVEIAIDAPEGDAIPENNRRILAFDVARERVRLLHVAGRPTYDVRALRTWLKSNASVDVIAFFILRTERSDVQATDSELALIRFPVDELFTEQLPSFDAVVLQDFNAEPYRLLRYIPNLARYVEGGGGFVMVGGPDAFLGGRYQGTDLERVLPVDLKNATSSDATFDLSAAVPRPTEAGRAAPMLGPLRALFGDELPSMPGVNLVGDARPGALVLWEHPSRKTRSGRPMPLLALGEYGDGRSVAIALDGVHRLGFSEFAERVAGRGHGALWDGLLGWLMRDPRFEPAQVELPSGCIAGEPTTLRVSPLPGTSGPLEVEVVPASERKVASAARFELPSAGAPVDVPIGALGPGGYMARVKVGGGSGTRRAFACEVGGDEWADPRPDEDRLAALAAATGGRSVRAKDAASLRFPPALEVNAERTVTPLLPPWLWTLAAALTLGLHWLARRRGGMA
jgi:uncharacterized membrane protein